MSGERTQQGAWRLAHFLRALDRTFSRQADLEAIVIHTVHVYIFQLYKILSVSGNKWGQDISLVPLSLIASLQVAGSESVIINLLILCPNYILCNNDYINTDECFRIYIDVLCRYWTVCVWQDLYGEFTAASGQSRRSRAWNLVLEKAKQLHLVKEGCSVQQLKKGVIWNAMARTRGEWKNKDVIYLLMANAERFCHNYSRRFHCEWYCLIASCLI